MADGILNLDKPRGLTSHDVVRRVRALTGIRRIGHAGTLDPLATGVLVVCVGRATRVAEYLMTSRYGGEKVYRARVRLGIATDTFDAEGQVLVEAPVVVSREQVEAALERFRGAIAQVPPMYSAVKRQGTPLYRFARRGIEVAREARQVIVSRLELVAWEPPELTLEITCSPGTYVRALANDLGETLGCGAHLTALTRLASGDFRLDRAITLETLSQAALEGRWCDFLYPIDAALSRLPAVHLDIEAARRLCLGQAIPLSLGDLQPPFRGSRLSRTAGSLPVADTSVLDERPVRQVSPDASSGEAFLARAYRSDGVFLAVVACDSLADVWRPRKVFCSLEG